MAKAKSPKRSKDTVSKEVTVRYYRDPDFRFIPATGALVRHDNEALVLSFYLDDKIPKEQVGKLTKKTDIAATYELGTLVEEACRREQVGIRMTFETAILVGNIILDRVQGARPDLFPETAKQKK